MILGEESLLEQFSNLTLVHDTYWLDATRYLIAAVSGATAALLMRLYMNHRTGRMNRSAGVGATLTYVVVAWAQLAAIGGPNEDLTLLNVSVLLAVSLSLIGTVQAMDVTLFSARRPQPSSKEASRTEIDRIGEVADRIEHAVNSRDPDAPTVSEDVAAVRRHIEQEDH